MIDALYIRDQTGRTVLSFKTPNSIDASTLVAHVPRDRPSYGITEVTPSQLVFHENYGHLQILVPCAVSAPPLVVQEFVAKFIDAVEVRFDALMTEQLLVQHRDTLMLILHHMLDAGFPATTEPDIVRELVPEESILTRILGSSGSGSSGGGDVAQRTGSNPGGLGREARALSSLSSISVGAETYPWRRSDVRHTKEELFIDVIEKVSLHIEPQRRRSHHSHATVRGSVEIVAMLSGTAPRIEIELNHALPAGTRLNRCIDRRQWNSSHNQRLVCVPADGPSVLAQYERDAPDGGPVTAELQRNTGDDNNEFEVHVSTPIDTTVKSIQSLILVVVFPKSPGRHVKELRATTGDFDTVSARWTFGSNVPTGWNATLRASATSADGSPLQPLYLQVSYAFQGRVPSRTVVKSVHVDTRRDASKPFRGVRYQTRTESYVSA